MHDTEREIKHRVFSIRSSGEIRTVALSDVSYAEVFDRKILLHMTDGEEIEYYGRMRDLEALAGSDFFRVHRAYLVNLKSISSYASKHVKLKGADIPVARGKYRDLARAYMLFQIKREACR